ncbi:serine hydrolase domain-containing protein [Brevibacterium jeotgali]|uniref:CubicO group peptidase, beta-lactamase class C family n=1 Tax=Brevibacterium jeotgali TaxID=1262550 RepID=A0A2H1L7Z9_9MICO|nr:serine hydrolase domain-containing protein [Brevibacterium jeotgali]TWC03354.1 CubicO group peptidase (beta-lactamase class C family) [Brevibacterium jeotgali]SMY13016.1 CubicO group peptidase, beta-lactamase class C family [Brevibacterium jeotgali]
MTTGQALEAEARQTAERIGRRRRGVVVGVRRGAETSVVGAGDTGRGAVPDAQTLVEIGSITKVFTSLLLADGVVRGDWELQTPVRELLPDGASVPGRADAAVTLQHLATHTSGLVRSPSRIGLRQSLRFLQFGHDVYAGFSGDDLLEALATTRLRRKPGTGGVTYSNFGFGVLGHALAHALGQDFGQAVTERICKPLGLIDTATDWQLTDEQRERSAQGFRGRTRPAAPWPLEGLPGAGALRSTASDVLTFLQAQLEPDSTPLTEAIRLTHQTPAGGPAGMGLGWHRAGTQVLWHNGGTGGFRTIAAVRPGEGTAVTVLVNQAAGADLAALRLLKRVS